MAVPAALSVEQTEVYQSMPVAWQKMADQAVKVHRELVDDLILKKYKLGEIVRDLRGNEAKYGESAVESLAKVMGVSAPELWQVQRLVTCYSPEALQKLMGRAGKNGYRMQWGHLRLLCDLSEQAGAGVAKTRRELETQCILRQLTVKELNSLIKERLGARSAGSGRTPAPPRSPAQGLQQIVEFSNNFYKRLPGYEDHVFDAIEKAGEDQISEETKKHLEQSMEAQLKLRETIDTVIKRTTRAMQRVDRVLHGTEAAKPVVNVKKPTPAAAKKTTSAAAEAASRLNNKKRQRRHPGALAK